MTSGIDVSRAPRGEIVAAQLVTAVTAADDRVERHYLELKSNLDLTKKTDIAKIAKYILASANRMPDVAATAFEGYGVMVIGVAPGDARGVPPIEVLEIDKIVSRYLGAAGPRWDLVRVPVPDSENEVLVIVVDPPKNGQQPFPCRKDGDGLVDGRIYIRADGETREAKGDEIDRLLERGAVHELPNLSFGVVIDGVAHPVTVSTSRSVDDYVNRTTQRLLDALPKPEPEPIDVPPALASVLRPQIAAVSKMQAELAKTYASSSAFSMLSTDPESRTEAEFRTSIDGWAMLVRERWPGAVDELAGRLLSSVTIRAKNETKTFLQDVELKIHLEGSVRGAEWIDDGDYDSADLGLPDPPRSWGPTQRSTFPDMLGTSYSPSVNMPFAGRSTIKWNNSGSVDLSIHVGDLRPLGEYVSDDDELILLVPRDHDADTVEGTWHITARGHNEIYTGTIAVKVAEPADLTSDMRILLGLDLDNRAEED